MVPIENNWSFVTNIISSSSYDIPILENGNKLTPHVTWLIFRVCW
jgi:hypothetical protein